MVLSWLKNLSMGMIRGFRRIHSRKSRNQTTSAILIGNVPAVTESLEQRRLLTSFTIGNIAVLEASSATANNTTASILELKPTVQSTPVQTIAINGTTGSSALRISGANSTTGYLANTDDGQLLTFTGANTTSTTSDASTYTKRGVGTLNNSDSFSLKTTYTGATGNAARTATSINDSTWTIADQGGIYTNNSTSATVSGNYLSVKSFGGLTYVLSDSSLTANVGIVSGNTITSLPGLPAANSKATDFYLAQSGTNGLSYDELYILAATSATAGTISKYSLVSGVWVANGSYSESFGGFGLAATNSGSGTALYASTGAGNTAGNNVDALLDSSGYDSTINITSNVTIYTAPSTATIKGVALAPTPSMSITGFVSANVVSGNATPTILNGVGPAGLNSTLTSSQMNGSTLSISITSNGDTANDVLGITSQGTSQGATAGQITAISGVVYYAPTTETGNPGVSIGTYAGGTSGSPLTITLNSNATTTSVSALLNVLNFQTISNSTSTRTVQLTFTPSIGNGGPVIKSDSVHITVYTPVINPGSTITLGQNAIYSGATLSGINDGENDGNTNVKSVVASVTSGNASLFAPGGAPTVTNFSSATGTATLRFTLAPNQTGTATITVTVTNSTQKTTTTTYTLTVNPITLASTGLSVSDGNSVTITSASLSAAETGVTPNNIQYTVTGNPVAAYGTFYKNGTALTQNSTFTQADINAGLISYVSTGTAATTDNFAFNISDLTYGGSLTGQSLSITDQAKPIITWANPADINYGTALSTTQLNATANVAGSFSYSQPIGTVLGAGNNQAIIATFTPNDTVDYTSASATVYINVHQANPVITWSNPADINYGTALSTTQLNATANVAGSFSYSQPIGTILGAGNNQAIIATFTPTDTVDYTSASATVYINLHQANPVITWSNPADINYGTALSATQLNATANVAGSFSYSQPIGTVLGAGNNLAIIATFTPNDTVDYTSASATVYINVHQANPVITWSNPADITYGRALSAPQLDATANVAGSFSYSQPIGTVLGAGNNQAIIATFTPTDTVDYTSASATVYINVLPATPVITWSNPADITYGTALSGTQLDATANVSGSFLYSQPIGAVLGAGSTQAIVATFAPTDTIDYTAATATVYINVNQATPVITWSNPASIFYGTALGSQQLNATANVPGSFAYSPPAGTVLDVGNNQILEATFTPTDTTDYQTVTDQTQISVMPLPVVLSGSTLTIYGTPGNDTVSISDAIGIGGLVVNFDGTNFSYNATSVTQIFVKPSSGNDTLTVNSLLVGTTFIDTTGSGNDSVFVNPRVTAPVTLYGGTGDNTLSGGAGNDLLIGGNGNSLLIDGDGRDRLIGGDGNSTLIAGDGYDTLIGGSQNNTITVGNGNDTIYGGTWSNTISAGNGTSNFIISAPTVSNATDTLTDTGSTSSLNLTAFTDGLTFSLAAGSTAVQNADPSNGFQLSVSNNAFNIVTLGGAVGTTNVVTGNSSLGTKIIGGGGDNTITGGTGNDTLFGGTGNSLITGFNGNDTLYGGTGNTTINAGNGNDTVIGETGNLNVTLGDGNDKLEGGYANNTLIAGNGTDSFYGGYWNNSISAGSGRDNFVLSAPTISNAVDTLIATGSTSTLNMTAFTDGLTFSLAAGTVLQTADTKNGFQLGVSNNAFSIVDLGGNTNTTNVVTGNSTLGTKIVGGNGDNTITGGSGNDTLYGGSGNSLITDGNGNDTLYGGSGSTTITAGNGNDLVIGETGNVNATAGNGNDKLIGGYANSTLVAGDGNDTVIGGSHNNTIAVGNGADTLYGGTWSNMISAGSGRDSFIIAAPTVNNTTDTLTDAGSTSTLNLTSFTDGLTFSLAAGSTVQNADPSKGFLLSVSNNAFSIVNLGGNVGTTNLITGNSTLGTRIVGGSGDNTITGGSGNDTLYGGTGNSLINDGNGNDTLYGGSGNSTIVAGNGNDLVIGETGNINATVGNGNDKLVGGYANSTLIAGNGNDSLYTGNGSNLLTTGTGRDTIFLSVPTTASSKDTLSSTGTTTTLNMTAFSDGLTFSMAAGSGVTQTADSSTGFQLDIANNAFNTVDLGGVAGTTNVVTGNSSLGTKIIGGYGENTITGGSGNDTLYGGTGNSLITDGNGNDTLYGGSGNTTLVAGNGNDLVIGETGNLNVTVGSGNDKLVGGYANNTLVAGDGNDSLYTGNGSNVLTSGTGRDTFYLSVPTVANSIDTLSSSGTANTLNLTAFSNGLTFNMALGSGHAQSAGSNGFQLDIQNNVFSTVTLGGVAGTTNVVTGNSTLGTKIVGGYGDNTITGGSGNDFLIGGTGNNLLTDGNGNDTVYGGNGNSTIIAGNGNDKLVGGYANSTLTAGDGNDTVIGGSLNNTITVGNGNDSLYGGTESNLISAGSGTSKFILSAPTMNNAKDTLTDTGSKSTLSLTAFNDGLTFSLAAGSGVVQTADSSNGFQLDVENNSFAVVDLGGVAGTTNIVIGNSTLSTKLVGGYGNNVLVGGAGNDALYGWTGRDILIGGGGGTDSLNEPTGGQGAILIGGNINFADPLTALIAIESEWASSDSYATRIADIRGSNGSSNLNGSYFLTNLGGNPTVTLGTIRDTLTGDGANDWFWATALDITNRQTSEVLN